MDKIDFKWMDRALDLAERGRYGVSPNPMVGAVVVGRGRLVGEGFHRRAGAPHAEVEALERAGASARGGDLYVTLEPCAHFGRTPPCSDAILAAGISRVIVAARDPNPLVGGKGLSALAKAGVVVGSGTRQQRDRAHEQNEKFRTWIAARRPFVLAKWAATLDGKIADASGRSRWITGEPARRRALLLREEYDAVLVGAATVAADDPLLSRRLGKNRTPHWRIVLDGRLSAPETSRLFRSPEGVLVATSRPLDHPRARRLVGSGVAVWSLPSSRAGRVSLPRLLRRLAREDVTSLMVEGGAETLGEFFDARLVDRVAIFFAPRLLGGASARGAIGGRGFSLRRAPWLTDVEVERLGQDVLVTGKLRRFSRP